MSTLTLPQARISLGWVTINDVRLPVEIDNEWMRAFTTMAARSGGISGSGGSTSEATFESSGSVLASEVFGRRANHSGDVRGDAYIDVTRDAQGFQLTLTPERLVRAIAPFLQRPATIQFANASEAVLATQIFGP